MLDVQSDLVSGTQGCTPSMTVCDHYSDSDWPPQYDFMQPNWLCVAFTMTLWLACPHNALTMTLYNLTMILCIPLNDSCDTMNYVTFKWLCDTDNDLFWASEWFYVPSQWIPVALQWLFIQSKWLLCDFDNKYGCMYNESVWISHWLVTFTDPFNPLAWLIILTMTLCALTITLYDTN